MPSIWEIGMWVVVVMGAWLTIRDIMDYIQAKKQFEQAKANGRIIYHFKAGKRARHKRNILRS